MYKCIKDMWTFIYKINDLETPLEKLVSSDSLWMKVIGDVGSGDYIIRLRSKCGICVLDLTEEEFYEHFERVD